MISLSASGLSPILVSASMPRSRKISRARGLSASAISTLAMGKVLIPEIAGAGSGCRRAADLAIGPVEPGQQRLDVGALDGGARPDAQARRRIAMARDVVGHT